MSTSIQELGRWMDAPRESEHLEFKEAKNQLDTTKILSWPPNFSIDFAV